LRRSYRPAWPLRSWSGIHWRSGWQGEYFDVAVENLEIVEGSQSLHNLHKDVPDLFLFELAPLFLVLEDLLQQISSVGVFHDDTEYRVSYHRDLVAAS
jgi:hypothetical protein